MILGSRFSRAADVDGAARHMSESEAGKAAMADAQEAAHAVGPTSSRVQSGSVARTDIDVSRPQAVVRRPNEADAIGAVSLARHSEFSKLGAEAKAALAGAFVRRSYGENDFIYLQDDDAEHLYFIRSGYVRLSYLMEDGSAILHGILPPGETFGELGVFEGGAHSDMATAVGNVVVASVPIHVFRQLEARHPEIGAAVGRAVARRYRSYLALTRMLSLKTLAARLAQALLRLADGLGTRTRYLDRECPSIGSMVTQTDLGLMARGARGNVNRALKSWERAGWIAIQDRSIVILDRSKLDGLSFREEL
jgi:CRP/FNR family cyclic AMP-dependent transcriptional regulator